MESKYIPAIVSIGLCLISSLIMVMACEDSNELYGESNQNTVVFLLDGETVALKSVDDVRANGPPDMPDREGYTGQWYNGANVPDDPQTYDYDPQYELTFFYYVYTPIPEDDDTMKWIATAIVVCLVVLVTMYILYRKGVV